MPRNPSINEAMIVRAGVELMRKIGWESFTVRQLAEEMGCSTWPIYYYFRNVDELKAAVLQEVTALYTAVTEQEMASGLFPPYKAYGMGYIRFAKEEPALFCALFMRKRQPGEEDAPQLGEQAVSLIAGQTGLPREKAMALHGELWIFVHGIATMIATSYRDWDEETISAMITDVYAGVRDRFLKGDDNG